MDRCIQMLNWLSDYIHDCSLMSCTVGEKSGLFWVMAEIFVASKCVMWPQLLSHGLQVMLWISCGIYLIRQCVKLHLCCSLSHQFISYIIWKVWWYNLSWCVYSVVWYYVSNTEHCLGMMDCSFCAIRCIWFGKVTIYNILLGIHNWRSKCSL